MSVGTSRQPDIVDGGLRLHLVNDTAGLEAAQQTLHAFLAAEGVGTRGIYRTELAFEELVVNVIRHGYADREVGTCPIDVSVRVLAQEIVLAVEDDGPPFDPLQVPDPELPATIDEARIGGLGLHLVRKSTQRMEYERTAGRNRVTLSLQRT
jgi:serine/threonine-protein kinase RsbW